MGDLVVGNSVVHSVANGNHLQHFRAFRYWQVADLLVAHQLRAVARACSVVHREQIRGLDGRHQCSFRIAPLLRIFPRIVALRKTRPPTDPHP